MTILAWKYNVCKIQVQYKIYANLQIDCLWVPYHKAKRTDWSKFTGRTWNYHKGAYVTMTAMAMKTSLKKRIYVGLKLYHTYSILFNSSNVGKFFGVEFLRTVWKFKTRKTKFLSCVPVLDKTWNYALSNCSRAKLLFCLIWSCCFSATLVAIIVVIA